MGKLADKYRKNEELWSVNHGSCCGFFVKRKVICVEKDFDYWKASCKRLEDQQRQGVLF